MKNALAKLWKMYEDSMIDQIKAQTKCNQEIGYLSEQKDKVQRKHTDLTYRVRKWTAATQQCVLGPFWQITDYPAYSSFAWQAKSDLAGMEQENMLNNDLKVLKSTLECDKDRIMWKEKKWDKAMGDLIEENKNLVHKIADLVKAGDQNETKLKRIKSICDG
jgi:hypothetical protein